MELTTNENTQIEAAEEINKVYCSFKPTTIEDKKKLFNAVKNCDVLIKDAVGQKIAVKDIYIAQYEAKSDDGKERLGHKTILFDESGKTYVTTSNYFYNELTQLLTVFGNPDTWDAPLSIEIKNIPARNGKNAISFKLA